MSACATGFRRNDCGAPVDALHARPVPGCSLARAARGARSDAADRAACGCRDANSSRRKIKKPRPNMRAGPVAAWTSAARSIVMPGVSSSHRPADGRPWHLGNGRWARRVSNLRPLACEAEPERPKKAQETALKSQTDRGPRHRDSVGVCGVSTGFAPPNARSGQNSRPLAWSPPHSRRRGARNGDHQCRTGPMKASLNRLSGSRDWGSQSGSPRPTPSAGFRARGCRPHP